MYLQVLRASFCIQLGEQSYCDGKRWSGDMVGMRDVAKKAGVSLSTVSLVVNGAGCVSDDMKKYLPAAFCLEFIDKRRWGIYNKSGKKYSPPPVLGRYT